MTDIIDGIDQSNLAVSIRTERSILTKIAAQRAADAERNDNGQRYTYDENGKLTR